MGLELCSKCLFQTLLIDIFFQKSTYHTSDDSNHLQYICKKTIYHCALLFILGLPTLTNGRVWGRLHSLRCPITSFPQYSLRVAQLLCVFHLCQRALMSLFCLPQTCTTHNQVNILMILLSSHNWTQKRQTTCNMP